MKKVNKVKSITILGLFTAITIVLANTIGFIPLGPLAITLMHLPVLIGAFSYGKEFGAVMGLIFGLISLSRSYTNPGPTSFIMMNPLVSVIPRLAFGFLAGLIYEGMEKSMSPKMRKLSLGLYGIFICLAIYLGFSLDKPGAYLAYLAGLMLAVLALYGSKEKKPELLIGQTSAIISTGLHSIMVLGAIYLLYADQYVEILGKAVDAIVIGSSVNMVFEMMVAAIITPPIVNALKKGK